MIEYSTIWNYAPCCFAAGATKKKLPQDFTWHYSNRFHVVVQSVKNLSVMQETREMSGGERERENMFVSATIK